MLQDFDQHLSRVAKSDEWAKVVHARSDISDERGYTSYLEEYGVLRLPTLVLFRNGRPLLYSYDEPFTQSGVEKWLHKCVHGRVGSSAPSPRAPTHPPTPMSCPTRTLQTEAAPRSTGKAIDANTKRKRPPRPIAALPRRAICDAQAVTARRAHPRRFGAQLQWCWLLRCSILLSVVLTDTTY